jgi:signal peptidase I
MSRKRKSEKAGGKAPKAQPAGRQPAVKVEAATPDRRPFDWWRENLEAFGIAVILAVVIRHFAVEAFEIPTGSMAETLYGLHAELQCSNCSTWYNVALRSDSSTGKVTTRYRPYLVYEGPCGNPECGRRLHARSSRVGPLRAPGDEIQCGACGTAFQGRRLDDYKAREALVRDTRCPLCHLREKDTVLLKSNRHGGHKILVNKFAYSFGQPQRWDVIVFEFDQWKNYIKRLVGLPGERIDVWDGDLYVNGRIERKTDVPRVQKALWTLISDSDLPEKGFNPVEAWAEVASAESGRRRDIPKVAEWDPRVQRWRINAREDHGILHYQRGFDNYYSYNLLQDTLLEGTPPLVEVGDKKVAFTARVVARGPQGDSRLPSWMGAEIRDGDFSFRLQVPVGTASEENPAMLVRLQNDPGSMDSHEGPSIRRPEVEGFPRATARVAVPVGEPVRIEFENVDDRVAARIDGEEVLVIEYSSLPVETLPERISARPQEPSLMRGGHYIHLLATNLEVELESIQVWRDMYYIADGGRLPWTRRGIELGPEEYFAMGDNAPSSSDGRYWGAIPTDHLMGRAFVVFWPLLSMNRGFTGKFIR